MTDTDPQFPSRPFQMPSPPSPSRRAELLPLWRQYLGYTGSEPTYGEWTFIYALEVLHAERTRAEVEAVMEALRAARDRLELSITVDLTTATTKELIVKLDKVLASAALPIEGTSP